MGEEAEAMFDAALREERYHDDIIAGLMAAGCQCPPNTRYEHDTDEFCIRCLGCGATTGEPF